MPGLPFTKTVSGWLTRNLGDSFRVGGNEGSLLDLEAALHADDIYIVDDVPELARDCAALLLVQESSAGAWNDISGEFLQKSTALRRWAHARAAPLRPPLHARRL